jgi:hypothetical protein
MVKAVVVLAMNAGAYIPHREITVSNIVVLVKC